MSVITFRVVACDCCEDETEAAPKTAEVRRFARKDGWTRPRLSSGYRIDLCPKCSTGSTARASEVGEDRG